MQSAKQLARTGIFYLEEAILEVLFEKRETSSNPCVPNAEIERQIGLYRKWEMAGMDGWITRSVLQKLASEARVEQVEKGGPWRITDAEYESRKD